MSSYKQGEREALPLPYKVGSNSIIIITGSALPRVRHLEEQSYAL